MKGGLIFVEKARGTVRFFSRDGREVLSPMFDLEVKLNMDFPGITLVDAIKEAKSFAAGALKQRVAQKLRGKTCFPVASNVDVRYRIKYGFDEETGFQRELEFKAGEQILRKGEYGKEFFWIKEGLIESDKVIYKPGSVFGRAAFNDCIRKRNVYAKTRAKVIAINKDHPDVRNKLPVILKKFSEEGKLIHKVRPGAHLDKITGTSKNSYIRK